MVLINILENHEMTMRIAHISQFWRPPLQQRDFAKLSAEAMGEAIVRKSWSREDISDAVPPAPCPRRSRLSPEKRAEILAETRRGYEELRSRPDELRREIAEGNFWDSACTDPITEE